MVPPFIWDALWYLIVAAAFWLVTDALVGAGNIFGDGGDE